MNSFNNIKNVFNELFCYKEKNEYDFYLLDKDMPSSQNDEITSSKNVFLSISENLNYIKNIYSLGLSSDVKIRKFRFLANGTYHYAFMVFIDGMVNSQSINDFVLKPLMHTNKGIKKVSNFNLEKYILSSLLPQNDISKKNNFKDIISDINSGNCAFFVDNLPIVFSLDVKGFKHRNIAVPQNEVVVRGSQESFVEVIRVNTSILRRLTNTEHLIVENTSVGKISNTKVAICYINNIANDKLVSEVRKRINKLDIDSLVSSRTIRTAYTR